MRSRQENGSKWCQDCPAATSPHCSTTTCVQPPPHTACHTVYHIPHTEPDFAVCSVCQTHLPPLPHSVNHTPHTQGHTLKLTLHSVQRNRLHCSALRCSPNNATEWSFQNGTVYHCTLCSAVQSLQVTKCTRCAKCIKCAKCALY